MRRLLTVVLHDGTEHDIALTAPDSTPIAEVYRRFAVRWGEPPEDGTAPRTFRFVFDGSKAVGEPVEQGRLYAGRLALDPDLTLGRSPLRDGVRVGFGAPDERGVVPDGEFELRVVAGTDAGRVVRISRSTQRELVVIPMGGVPDTRHRSATFVLHMNGGDRLDVAAIHGGPMALDGQLLRPTGFRQRNPGLAIEGGKAYPWPSGALLTIHDRCLEFGPAVQDGEPEGYAEVGPGGTRWFNRPPRRLRVTAVPVDEETRPGRRPLRSGLRLPGRRRPEPPAGEPTARRRTLPGPVEIRRAVGGRLMWERRPVDKDFLRLRCGLLLSDTAVGESARQESAVSGPTDPPDPLPAPVGRDPEARAVDLTRHGVIGLAGSDDRVHRAAAWLAAQTAVLHRPQDVVLRVLAADEQAAADWRWLRWLPRSGTEFDRDDRPRVYAGRESVAAQMPELLALLREPGGYGSGAGPADPGGPRQQGPYSPDAGSRPAVLLILDGVRALWTVPGIRQLIERGPSAGVYVICTAARAPELPPQCGADITLTDRPLYTAARGRPVRILPDLPPRSWFDEVARALAPIRDAETERRARDLRTGPLLELLDLEPPDPAVIAARWQTRPRSTSAAVGRGEGGAFELDLRRHGPHALVTGATGSGKTEFLRAWVASLAVANRPDELQFVLIDYKGGAAFGPLAELPHVTTLLTDLDSVAANRILTRLAAALRERESRLVAARAKDLEDYQYLRERDPALPALPRLVVVVEEFASLVREFPELVAGLANLAQRGRSLGVHLVLATQRPAGVVSTDLRALTNLRVALRVVDSAESVDVIDAPDAGHIPRSAPGRAFVRTGTADLVEIQTAWAGGITAEDTAVLVRELDAAGATPPPADPLPLPYDTPTDLDRLAEAVTRAADLLDVPQVPGPLPPPLPPSITLGDLPPLPTTGRDLAPVPYGLEDVPDELDRRTAVFDLVSDSALAVVGAPRSGRSQFLRTFAASVARRHSTADVHLFAVDAGDGALQALAELPHCGAVVNRYRPERLARLIGRLTATVYSRRELLAAGGFADVTSQRQAVPVARRLPYLVLLIDRWEEFVACAEEWDGGSMVDEMTRLLREGPSAGVRVIVTGEVRLLTNSRFASLVGDRLLLDLGSRREDWAGLALGRATAPVRLNPGRALRPFSAAEVQIALLDGVPTTRGQTDALDRLAVEVRARDADVPETRRPFRIEDTPRAADQFHVGAGRGRPVGREDVLAWLRDRHATGASAALLGPRRAGKTWVLEELSRRMVADGFRAVHALVVPQAGGAVDSPDALAAILDREVREAASPAEALLDKAAAGTGSARLMFLLDEVGRLAGYGPAAVSWLRDLGQAGAWLVYTGTEKDWRAVVRHALTLPGSSFGNDVNARPLGPLDTDAAVDFLSGTAANLGVNLGRDTTAARIVDHVGTWPFYLQVAGDAVVRSVQGNDLGPLTGTDALQSLLDQRLLDDWTHHFAARWAEIGPAGRAALLTAPGTMPTDASLAQRQDLREVGLLRPGEQWLDDRPFLGWIARNSISLRDGESG
ncbi:FtsK/SpoIIIE domain-containing protein [Actinacidiphila acididurans]|nr:FtsK/SpoIIIE domain-containing protein [Actinacidiphila acididurans]